VLGWFVVRENEASGEATGAASPGGQDPLAAVAADVSAAAPVPDVFQSAPPPAPGGQVDYAAVFDAAGIDAEERERVEKARQLLASLPAETPVAVRKQIVEASLKAFGVPIDKIIEAGVQEIQALEGYIRGGAADTQKVLDESARRIAQYEAEIRNIRTVMEQRVVEQQAVASACNAKKLEVQQVLEFFGQEAVARVVRESPKLIEPAAPPA
jgi:ADP-dependent phosphofructokinase/glucokinase